MNCKFKVSLIVNFLFVKLIALTIKKCHYSLGRYISTWYFVPLKV